MKAASAIRRNTPAIYRRLDGGEHANKRHGHARDGAVTPEYRTWQLMRRRCEKPWDKRYHRYGGRGIRVCERWHVFENFLADMGRKPPSARSIDRIDNDGDYEPGNCRWATALEQSRNRPYARRLPLDGEMIPIVEWCERTGLSYTTVHMRLTNGWKPGELLTRVPMTPQERGAASGAARRGRR